MVLYLTLEAALIGFLFEVAKLRSGFSWTSVSIFGLSSEKELSVKLDNQMVLSEIQDKCPNRSITNEQPAQLLFDSSSFAGTVKDLEVSV